jgi:hypothetical protein
LPSKIPLFFCALDCGCPTPPPTLVRMMMIKSHHPPAAVPGAGSREPQAPAPARVRVCPLRPCPSRPPAGRAAHHCFSRPAPNSLTPQLCNSLTLQLFNSPTCPLPPPAPLA